MGKLNLCFLSFLLSGDFRLDFGLNPPPQKLILDIVFNDINAGCVVQERPLLREKKKKQKINKFQGLDRGYLTVGVNLEKEFQSLKVIEIKELANSFVCLVSAQPRRP